VSISLCELRSWHRHFAQRAGEVVGILDGMLGKARGGSEFARRPIASGLPTSRPWGVKVSIVVGK